MENQGQEKLDQELEQEQNTVESDTEHTGSADGDTARTSDAVSEAAVDEKGVPWKNRAMEYRRKYDKLQKEIAEMKAALQSLQTQKPVDAQPTVPPSGDDDIAELIKTGYDPNAVRAIDKLVQRRVQRIMDGLAPVVTETYASKMEQQLSKLKSDPAIGSLVAAYEPEIREQMKEVRTPALLADERALRAALGIAMSEHPERLATVLKGQSTKSIVDTQLTESTPGQKRVGGASVSQTELAEFMGETGITDEKRAREILAKRNNVLRSKTR
jgi:hypothetical protein